MPVILPPAPIIIPSGNKSVFLAGSIEMGTATDWQHLMIEQIDNEKVTILNPRRATWDARWEQSIANPNFKEQVSWELEGLERADLIAVYFDPATKAPVTLLELGLYAQSGKLAVCCPEGFWRKGNVDIVCERYAIRQVDTLAELIATIQARLGILTF
jgi:hypothetical protein